MPNGVMPKPQTGTPILPMQFAGKVHVGLASCPERNVAVVAEAPGDGRAGAVPAVPTGKGVGLGKSILYFPPKLNL